MLRGRRSGSRPRGGTCLLARRTAGSRTSARSPTRARTTRPQPCHQPLRTARGCHPFRSSRAGRRARPRRARLRSSRATPRATARRRRPRRGRSRCQRAPRGRSRRATRAAASSRRGRSARCSLTAPPLPRAPGPFPPPPPTPRRCLSPGNATCFCSHAACKPPTPPTASLPPRGGLTSPLRTSTRTDARARGGGEGRDVRPVRTGRGRDLRPICTEGARGLAQVLYLAADRPHAARRRGGARAAPRARGSGGVLVGVVAGRVRPSKALKLYNLLENFTISSKKLYNPRRAAPRRAAHVRNG